jgi:hypothetical protein
MKVGAYFYPLTTRCAERARRGRLAGALTIDEHKLVAGAELLYPGHRQPKRYCLAEPSALSWDDSDASTMARQIELAQEFGLSFFVFNTYIGNRDGRPVRELAEPAERAIAARQLIGKLQFGVMLCFSGPHAYLPLPNLHAKFDEPNRYYDLTRESAAYIVRHLVDRYFGESNYLTITGKPYLALYADLGPGRRDEQHYRLAIDLLREEALRYGLELYVVGVCASVANGKEMFLAGADALTGYALLPDFHDSERRPVQDYESLLAKRERDWQAIAALGLSFVPPAVVGWDASPRGARGYTLEEVAGVYPFTPIVEGGAPWLFSQMLSKTLGFVAGHVPAQEQYGIVCAWNEISEGCALLPGISADGAADYGYLEALQGTLRASSLEGTQACRVRVS